MKTQTEYTFTKDGESIVIPVERWAWKVVYKPTEAQLARATQETIARRDEILKQGDKSLKALKKKGATDEEVSALRYSIQEDASVEIQPVCDEIRQFANDGTFRQFCEIDHSRAASFTMYRLDRALKQHTLVIGDSEDLQLFHFVRNIVLSANTLNEKRYRIYVFGAKNKVTGSMTYTYIMPDDRIVCSSSDIADLTNYLTLVA